MTGQLLSLPDDAQLDVVVAVHERRWLQVLPDFPRLCEQLILLSLSPFVPRWRIEGTGIAPLEVACILTGDAEIQELNLRFRGKDSATNVLSFAADPAGPYEHGVPHVLGDVIVSLDTLEREAKEQNKKLRDHASHMIVHGVLHLLGFDHLTDEEANEMEAHEIALLSRLGISNPYETTGEGKS